MSGSLGSVRWNACVHRLDLGLYSHPKEFLRNGVRTHVNSKGKIPLYRKKILSEEDRTHYSAPSRTASPTHHQRAIPAPQNHDSLVSLHSLYLWFQLALTHTSFRTNYGTNPAHARNSLTNCGLRQVEYGDRRVYYHNTRKRGINILVDIMSRMGRLVSSLAPSQRRGG